MEGQEGLNVREGATVYGADGGKVVAVDPSYVVVEKGFFFPTDERVGGIVRREQVVADDETVTGDESGEQGRGGNR